MPNLDLFLKTQSPPSWDDLSVEQKISLKLKVDEVLSDPAVSYINGLPTESRTRALSSELARRGYRPPGYNQASWGNLVNSAWESIYGTEGEVQRIINAYQEESVSFEEALSLVPEDGIISDDEVQSILDQIRSTEVTEWQQEYNTLLDVYKSHYGEYEPEEEQELPAVASAVVLQALLQKQINPDAMIRDTILVLGQSGIKATATQAHGILMSIEQLGAAIRDLELDLELGRPSLESVQEVLGTETPMNEDVLDALKELGFWKTKMDAILEAQEAARRAEEEQIRQQELEEALRLQKEAEELEATTEEEVVDVVDTTPQDISSES